MSGSHAVSGALIVIASVLASSSAHAQGAQESSPAIYSSVAHIDETGDVVGTELVVLRACDRVFVSYHHAEGSWLPINRLEGRRSGDTLRFVLPPDSARAMPSGRLVESTPSRAVVVVTARAGATLTLPDQSPDTLPRKSAPYGARAVPALRAYAARMCGHPSR
jgi:hypothetical protein